MVTKAKTVAGPDPEDLPPDDDEEPKGKKAKHAPKDEAGNLCWHESFNSMLDHPDHPLHHHAKS